MFMGGTGGHGMRLSGVKVVTTKGYQENCPLGQSAPDMTKKCKTDGCTPKDCCAQNEPCTGAGVLLQGAANVGTCKSNEMAAGKACTQVGKSGLTCSASVYGRSF